MLHTILVIIVVILAYLGIQSKKNAIKIIVIALVILGVMQIIFGSVTDPEFETTE